MLRIGAFEAKTHFSALLQKVMQGDFFEITHRGKTVAVLIAPEAFRQQEALNAFTHLATLRKKHPIGNIKEITAWKNKGKK